MTDHVTATELASQAAAAELRRAVDEVRSLPELSVLTLEESLRSQISGKIWWLEKFSAGRKTFPESEIQAKRLQLRALVQAYDIIRGRGALGEETPS